MDAGVEIEASELREEPSGPFSTKFKTRQRPADATTSVDAQTLQRLVQQQNSMAKFVKEQFEWQKKVNAHLTKGKMAIEEPVLPEWMLEIDAEENEDDVPLSTMQLRAVKKERVKRARSPVRAKKAPAKKKQKKVSSEEEELKSADLDSISEEDANESKKVSMEILSEEEEEHSEEKGSSSDKTDIVADSPPTKAVEEPSKKPSTKAKPKSPPPKANEPPAHHQNTPATPQSKPQDQPIPQPSPTQPEPSKEPHQPSSQKGPAEDVVTSEATEVGSNPEQRPKSPPKRLRVKHVPLRSPFGKKKRAEIAAASEETQGAEEEEEMQPPVEAASKRSKLQVKRKPDVPKGKPATATSAIFLPASGSETATREAAVDEERAADVTTSAEREAAQNLAELQAIRAHDAAVERAKEQALEEATQRLAEHLLKQAQDKVAAAGDVSTDVTTSQKPEVEKAQEDPKEPQQADPAELAKQKAWEDAKKRIAETTAKMTQEAGISAASSGAVGSDETTTTEAGGEKKEKKKKKAAQAGIPTRQSGRLRSGALNK